QVVEHETDRLKFLGRSRTAANPAVFEDGVALSGTTGPVLDPIFSLRRMVNLGAGATARVAFVTGAGDSHPAVRTIAERYSSIDAVDRTFHAASESYRVELQDLNLAPEQVSVFNLLIGNIAFANPALRRATAFRNDPPLDRSVLWSHGISGDLPIVLVRVDGTGDETLIREVLTAHEFSRRRCLQFDLVLFDQRGPDDTRRLDQMLQAGPTVGMLEKSGGIFVLSATTTPDDHVATI